MSNKIQILVVDDHPAVAFGTKMILEKMDGFEVAGVVHTGQLCMEFIANHHTDIIFLDFLLPDCSGMDVAAKIKELNENIHIVVFTGVDFIPLLNSFLDLRISGIMSKDSNEEQIHNMLISIMNGQTVIPLSLFQKIRITTEELPPSAVLSEEEIDIMSLIINGSTNEQIAHHIEMSKRSVDNYVRKIYDKFGVKSRAQAIEKYLQTKK